MEKFLNFFLDTNIKHFHVSLNINISIYISKYERYYLKKKLINFFQKKK